MLPPQGSTMLSDSPSSVVFLLTAGGRDVDEICHRSGTPTRPVNAFIEMEGSFYQDGIFTAAKAMKIDKR